MIRMLLYILAAIFAITLLKMFIGIIMRGLGSYLNSPAGGDSPTSAGTRPSGGTRKAGTLRKDSLTGVYVADEIAISKVINGRTHYFASEKNYLEYMQRVEAKA